MNAHENACHVAQNQRSWLRTASPCLIAAFYAGFHPQLLAEQALSVAWPQNSAQERRHHQKIYRRKLKMQQQHTASDRHGKV